MLFDEPGRISCDPLRAGLINCFQNWACARITRNIGEYTDCWPWVREVLEDIKSGRNKSKPRCCVHQSSPELLCYPGLIPGCSFQTVCQLLKVRWASRTLDLGSWWAPLPKLLMRDRHSPIACVVSSPTQVKTWKLFLGWKSDTLGDEKLEGSWVVEEFFLTWCNRGLKSF